MLAKVILDFGSARMRATTVAIDDPGPLERYLPDSGAYSAFIRRGEGFVALGEVAPVGKKHMAATDWARGARLGEHVVLGTPDETKDQA